jgi:glycosyltransferase involved in cell wall biosynthesis
MGCDMGPNVPIVSATKDICPADMPIITVTISTYNSANTIDFVLAALLSQTYPTKCIEVIMVDGHSQDNTVEKVKKFIASYRNYFHDIKLIIHDKNYGVSKARNDGILSATGTYLVVLDSDVILSPSSIKDMLEFLQYNPKVGCVMSLLEEDSQNFLSRAIFQIFYGKVREVIYCTAATMIPRDIIKSVGLYNEKLGPPFSVDEDLEFGARIWRAGYSCVVNGKIISKHLATARDQYLIGLNQTDKADSRVGKTKFSKTLTEFIRYLFDSFKKPHRYTRFVVLRYLPINMRIRYATYAFAGPAVAVLLLGLFSAQPLLSFLGSTAIVILYLDALRDYISSPRHIKYSIILATAALVTRSIRATVAFCAYLETLLLKFLTKIYKNHHYF